MTRRRIAVFVGVVGVVALLSFGSAGATRNAVLYARMTGAQEAPTPVNTPGVGTAVVNVDADNQRICVSYNFSRLLSPAFDAHIHRAPPGVAGPIVVPFPNVPQSTSGASSFCSGPANWTPGRAGLTVAQFLNEITENPGLYYVNIHSLQFRGGEIRGQLVLGSSTPTSTP